MSTLRDPVLTPVKIKDLRPTQMTVGMREVEVKRRELKRRAVRKIGPFLGAHMIPVVLGPRGRHYVVDHHHLSLALLHAGVSKVLVTVLADLSELEPEQFWVVLDHHAWVHPYDSRGRRRDFQAIPKSVEDLTDDVFRSLAGAVRREGGFAKDTTPFSEFLWADFLRRRISRKRAEREFGKTLKEAMKLAKSHDARYLPGWSGPVDE